MQTFLPFEDFKLTARVLDRQRLGKQRVECKQIFNALLNGGGWKNHPAVRMWRGHTHYLLRYYYTIVDEWKSRGYKHNMVLGPEVFELAGKEHNQPMWLGSWNFHERHRAMLVYKNAAHYAPLFAELGRDGQYIEVYEPGYVWPVPPEGSDPALKPIEINYMLPFK